MINKSIKNTILKKLNESKEVKVVSKEEIEKCLSAAHVALKKACDCLKSFEGDKAKTIAKQLYEMQKNVHGYVYNFTDEHDIKKVNEKVNVSADDYKDSDVKDAVNDIIEKDKKEVNLKKNLNENYQVVKRVQLKDLKIK